MDLPIRVLCIINIYKHGNSGGRAYGLFAFLPIRPSAGLGPHLFGQSLSPTLRTRLKMPPDMGLPIQPPPPFRTICYPHIGITYFQAGLAETQDSDFLGNF